MLTQGSFHGHTDMNICPLRSHAAARLFCVIRQRISSPQVPDEPGKPASPLNPGTYIYCTAL
jgi:hypothetical protein